MIRFSFLKWSWASMHAFKAIVLIGIVAICGLAMWQLQPWMRSGKGVHIGNWRFGEHEFQVWQRKNSSLVEPFATAVFIRSRTGEWRAYCLVIDDMYKPRVALREEDLRILVTLYGNVVGVFDPRPETFHRKADGVVFQPEIIGGDPPGTWWVSQKR